MGSAYTHPSLSTTTLLLFLPLALVTLGYIFYLNNFHMLSFSTTNDITSEMPSPANHAELNIFFGILTTPNHIERRHLLRAVYAIQKSNLATVEVDVRFILCSSINEEHKMFIALEIMLYGDVIILDCNENINDGKTYAYFSSLPSLVSGRNRPFDYVVKADDDAYFRFDNLAKFLKDKPREDLYYGMEMACDYAKGICGAHKTFMAGFGYVLSWDLVEWIGESDIARNNKTGLEDVMLAKWLNTAGKGKNRYNGVPAMYDYLGDKSEDILYRHNFLPETVAVHQLKGNLQWVKTLEYFNVTNSLKPSKLYRTFH